MKSLMTALTWFYMRFNSLVSPLQFPRGVDDVKGRVSPRINPDLF